MTNLQYVHRLVNLIDPADNVLLYMDYEQAVRLCELCVDLRRQRLLSMNLSQSILPPCEYNCGCCDG